MKIFNLFLTNQLTNFEIEKYYQIEPKSNDVYTRNNLSKIEDGTYITDSYLLMSMSQLELIGLLCKLMITCKAIQWAPI